MNQAVKIIRVNLATVESVPEFDIAVNAERWFQDFHTLTDDVRKGGATNEQIDYWMDLINAYQRLLMKLCEPISESVRISRRPYVIAILCDVIMFTRMSAMMELMADILHRSQGWSVTCEVAGH